MIDPITSNWIGQDHHRELVQRAERARLLRAARSTGIIGNQPGIGARIRAMAGHLFGARASGRHINQSEPAPDERPTAA